MAFVNCLTCFICNLSCVYAREHETDRCFMVEFGFSACACNKNVLHCGFDCLFTLQNGMHFICHVLSHSILFALILSLSLSLMLFFFPFSCCLFAFRLIPYTTISNIYMTIVGWLHLKRNHCCGFHSTEAPCIRHYGILAPYI